MSKFKSLSEFKDHYLHYCNKTQANAFIKAIEVIENAKIDTTSGLGCEILARYDMASAIIALRNLMEKEQTDYVKLYYLSKAIEYIACCCDKAELDNECFEFLLKNQRAFDSEPKVGVVKFRCFARAYYDVLRFLAYKTQRSQEKLDCLNKRNDYDKRIDSLFDGDGYIDPPIARIVPSKYASIVPFAQMLTIPVDADRVVMNLERIIADIKSQSDGLDVVVPTIDGLITYEYENFADQIKTQICSDFLAQEKDGYMQTREKYEIACVVIKICLMG